MPSRKKPPKIPQQSESGARPAAGRRTLLKSALLGGGAAATSLYMAPERWTRPIIQAVTLPVHAQTSPGDLGTGRWASGGDGIIEALLLREQSLAGRIVDFFVPPANGGGVIREVCPAVLFAICIETTGSGSEIQVRAGFDFAGLAPVDTQTFTPSGDLTFSRNFGDWVVSGEYDPDGDRWSGNVSGPCPEGDIFAGVDIEWTAQKDASCFFDA